MAIADPSSSEVGPSLEEILSRHGLEETDLDRECPRSIRNDVAVELGADWEMIGLYLEFSLDELGDIRQQHSSQEMCRVALLDVWGKSKGEGATFLKLARAFHRRKRRDLVDRLCAKLKSTLALVPLSAVMIYNIPFLRFCDGKHSPHQINTQLQVHIVMHVNNEGVL